MRYLKILLGTLALVCILFSCSTRETKNAVTAIEGYDKELLANDISPLLCGFKAIKLSSETQGILTNPTKIEIKDSVIYILDDYRLLIFDMGGNFLQKIGNKGHGNSEYINLSSFYFDGDCVALLDSYKNEIIRFDSNGSFRDKIKLSDGILQNVQNVALCGNESLFVYHYLFNDSHQLCQFINLRNSKTELLSETSMQSDNAQEFIGLHAFDKYDNRISYIRPFDNKVYQTKKGAVWEFPTESRIMSEDELKDISDFSIMTYAAHLNDNTFLGFTDIFETSDYTLLECHNLYYVIVDKRNNTCSKHSYGFSNHNQEFPLYNIMGRSDNCFIGVISPAQLQGLVNNEKGVSLSQRIHAETGTVLEEDNHILLLYFIK